MPINIALDQGGGGVEIEGSEVQGNLELYFKKGQRAETDGLPLFYGHELSLYMYSFYTIKELLSLLVTGNKPPEAFLPPTQVTASAVPHGLEVSAFSLRFHEALIQMGT